MEAKNEGSSARSLPPLVEGKVRGYIRLVIDEIVWCRRSPGDVTVLASWWGELDSAHFRPADIKSGVIRSDRDTTETYAIRTNLELFEEYLTNCETVELVVISERTRRIVGTSRVADLYNVLSGKTYFQYVPITNNSGNRIGDIHATMKLLNSSRNQKIPCDVDCSPKKRVEDRILFDDTNIMKNNRNRRSAADYSFKKQFFRDLANDDLETVENSEQEENIYRSILKSRKCENDKSSSRINDNLVAQVVARAQRLRGAIIKETRDDAALALTEDSSTDDHSCDRSLENDTALYEYFSGQKMSLCDEKKALETLRTTSPTPSIVDLASETIRNNDKEKNSTTNKASLVETIETKKMPNNNSLSKIESTSSKKCIPMDYVDSLRIVVECLSLSPAGWRRVKSSCLSRGDGIPISVTYFVQYDANFTPPKKSNKKNTSKDVKTIKFCSKKQSEDVVYFNHEAVYDLPKNYLKAKLPLKFKIFNRHLNQRTPTELGMGSMYASEASDSSNLSTTQRLAVVNKGMKIGELTVTVELGCDKIHFGEQFVESVNSVKENIPVVEITSSNDSSNDKRKIVNVDSVKTNLKAETSSRNEKNDFNEITSLVVSSNEKRKTCVNLEKTNAKATATSSSSRNDEIAPVETTSCANEKRKAAPEDSEIINSTATTSSSLRNEKNDRREKNDSLEDRRRSAGSKNRDIESVKRRRDDDEGTKLRGLIHVAEGRSFPRSTSYLVCRAFWREDRSSSEICENTDNPHYNFHQSMPLIHGRDLLERTKENFIVIEIHSKNRRGLDDVVGISKLSIHQLYVAYKHPDSLEELRRSKYPVISVDGWVNVVDPVTGKSRGRISALVALGTDEQIAFLEITRGLVEVESTNDSTIDGETIVGSDPTINVSDDRSNSETIVTNDRVDFNDENAKIVNDSNVETRECQTEITTVKNLQQRTNDEQTNSDDNAKDVLNAFVDRLTNALNPTTSNVEKPKPRKFFWRPKLGKINQTKKRNAEISNIGESTGNSYSEESDAGRPTKEIRRSVGVGAEFDEPENRGPSTSYARLDSGRSDERRAEIRSSEERDSTRQDGGRRLGFDETESRESATSHARDSRRQDGGRRKYVGGSRADDDTGSTSGVGEVGNFDNSEIDDTSFRALVEIECALHLPTVDKSEGTVEPCTYVTFQQSGIRGDSRYGSYVVTNLCAFSCSPQWDWRCDTRLSNDLLENEEKRLILKVWRLVDPETSMQIDLERDVVVGFSAIDVSVLTIGFPVVSGWFHVMDFTGKCNGQIKVSVTPLDNTSAGSSNTAGPLHSEFDRSNFSSSYPVDLGQSGNFDEAISNRGQLDNEHVFDDGVGLGDASMSFLSLSLKQKLTELDEIKKRLQSRLHDVTNTAFDDEDSNDYDATATDANRENREIGIPKTDTTNVNRQTETQTTSRSSPDPSNPNEDRESSNSNDNRLPIVNRRPTIDNSDPNLTDTGYSTSSNPHAFDATTNGSRRTTETDANRSQERSSSSKNGYEIPTDFVGRPSPSNGRHEARRSIPRNQNDPNPVRICRTVDLPPTNRHEQPSIIDTTSLPSNSTSDQQPLRGAKTHINHLLDKLTSQLTSAPAPVTNQPMKRNIIELITSLRRNNNNFSTDVKCNREVNVRNVPTQTDVNRVRSARSSRSSTDGIHESEPTTSNDGDRDSDEPVVPAKTKKREKVSTIVRRELIDDEGNELCDYDELSGHLMRSNVRHMNMYGIVNPLIYGHVVPDVGRTSNGSRIVDSTPGNSNDVDDVQRLDKRYKDSFTATINNGLDRLKNIGERDDDRTAATSSENDETFRLTPSGSCVNTDGNIDVTVVHKPCDDDVGACNSVESTTTISLGRRESLGATDCDDNSSLNESVASVSGVSRQAPDGGNPIEETVTTMARKRKNEDRDSSSDS